MKRHLAAIMATDVVGYSRLGQGVGRKNMIRRIHAAS